jgi:hypothetical protein
MPAAIPEVTAGLTAEVEDMEGTIITIMAETEVIIIPVGEVEVSKHILRHEEILISASQAAAMAVDIVVEMVAEMVEEEGAEEVTKRWKLEKL